MESNLHNSFFEQSLVDEMLKFGVPVELEKTTRAIISEILSDNCSIVFVRHYKELKSSAFTSKGDSHQIVISNDSVGHPVRMIFAVLHEWAHFRQVKRGVVVSKNPSSRYDLESDAWEIAKSDLDKYADLKVYEKEFYACRDESLRSYRRSLNSYLIVGLIFQFIYQGATIVVQVALIKYALFGICAVMGISSLPEIQKLDQESIRPLISAVLILLVWRLSGLNLGRNLSRVLKRELERRRKSMSKSYL